MYKIIGADGKPYGPVPAEQVRQWIAQGRANAHTKVLAEGAADWKPLSEFPEFAAALGKSTVAPAAPSGPVSDSRARADALAQEILTRDYHLQIGSCISRGWNLVMSHFWLTVGASLLMILLSTAASAIPFASLVLGMVLWSGLDWLFLKLVRGQKTELSDAFAGFSVLFVPLMLYSIVAQLLTLVGFLLCILPGIYLMVVWLMFPGLLILDKGLEFWPAMELSRKVVNRHWWAVFGLALLCLLLMFAGILACVIGFFIIYPVVVAAVVFAYEDIFGARSVAAGTTAALPGPAPTPAPEPAAPAESPKDEPSAVQAPPEASAPAPAEAPKPPVEPSPPQP